MATASPEAPGHSIDTPTDEGEIKPTELKHPSRLISFPARNPNPKPPSDPDFERDSMHVPPPEAFSNQP